eukprot:CAMPEP_0203808142 /NCGR_PEP_ID=MMETSP0115-20131106/1455_1 /ASSEMBLY_ACC=CAM_ASM_000227 /TAXON_ID=33651 /ORGANISM="Bicosoecid sp, Strain ms1" /LENGTH=373 /DNA_ID=CAMNT_0050716827 /DNA_START=360 /DNA_END=1477 /DNA_ORIENTATION=+
MASDSVLFYVYGALHLVLMLFALDKTRKRRTLVGFLVAPVVAFLLSLENFAVAGMVDAQEAGEVSTSLGSMRYFVHAFIYPLVLVTCYELGYKVHKTRSVNFCFIRFDEGHRDHNSLRHLALRGFPHLLSLVMCIISLVANADRIATGLDEGGNMRFASEGLHFDTMEADLDSVVDVVPTLAVAVVVTHTGASLWRYGTFYSTDVHATVINPWIGMLLGVVGLLLSALVTPADWVLPYATNSAEVVLMIGIVRAMSLIDHNLVQCELFEENLHETNEIGRRIVAGSKRGKAAMFTDGAGSRNGGGGRGRVRGGGRRGLPRTGGRGGRGRSSHEQRGPAVEAAAADVSGTESESGDSIASEDLTGAVPIPVAAA